MTGKVVHRFTREDDEIILKYYAKYPNDKERALNSILRIIGENHKPRSIEERYKGFLSKDMSPFTPEEDQTILEVHKTYKNKWCFIAKFLSKNRSGDQVKIRYFQLVREKMKKAKKTKKQPPPKKEKPPVFEFPRVPRIEDLMVHHPQNQDPSSRTI
ncbi:Myb-like DNA-binding domain containing protein [Trichomonas vaginalis G3]|uniref:Myb-like DNA-binding domain containing protein n=1 Tax=Trichomonas vaginalis (strain ATCC PRA-98 / G3) TaxID=412133 RepID=A2E8W1_TRIV3|nr:MYB protein-related family [Trichomonas vaginalis G3]EAY10943.1 Myb-like DNA-binding domain containing protein [Trichomonas vaginalis G3]KAI5485518.1 MYB protein-related family [Trichomonas vaginalis G3]|eukprot:XP_001323166.1 Myb-like DNA-binding domain containing protein [Trichomonas vaginalis G3]